jgi:hypothetical protein
VHARVFVRRFAPAACLLLDDGTSVEIEPDGSVPDGARVLNETGAEPLAGRAASESAL